MLLALREEPRLASNLSVEAFKYREHRGSLTVLPFPAFTLPALTRSNWMDGGKAFAKILETDTSLAWKLVFLVKSNFAPTSELTADHLDKRPGMHIILHPNMLFFLTKTSRFSRLQFNGLDDETKAAVTTAWGKRDGDKASFKDEIFIF